MDLFIRTNVDELKRRLTTISKSDLPQVLRQAANRTALAVAEAERGHMRQRFNQPRAATLNAVQVKMAGRDVVRQPALVVLNDSKKAGAPAARYLLPQIEGGPRGPTPFEFKLLQRGWLKPGEFLVPARYAETDSAGDLSSGQIVKIMTDLGALDTAVRGPNYRGRGRRAAQRYQFLRPGNGVPDGIYRVDGNRRLLCFIVVRQPHYGVRLDWKRVADQTIARTYAYNFRESLATILARQAAGLMQRAA